jgi:hypothetical protein
MGAGRPVRTTVSERDRIIIAMREPPQTLRVVDGNIVVERPPPMEFDAIGKAFGMSRQAAHQFYGQAKARAAGILPIPGYPECTWPTWMPFWHYVRVLAVRSAVADYLRSHEKWRRELWADA